MYYDKPNFFESIFHELRRGDVFLRARCWWCYGNLRAGIFPFFFFLGQWRAASHAGASNIQVEKTILKSFRYFVCAEWRARSNLVFYTECTTSPWDLLAADLTITALTPLKMTLSKNHWPRREVIEYEPPKASFGRQKHFTPGCCNHLIAQIMRVRLACACRGVEFLFLYAPKKSEGGSVQSCFCKLNTLLKVVPRDISRGVLHDHYLWLFQEYF